MTEELKKDLVRIVNAFGPIKATDILVRIKPEIISRLDIEQIFIALDELALEKEIIEVEYSLPHMKYRAKSIYFPKGTEVRVPGK